MTEQDATDIIGAGDGQPVIRAKCVMDGAGTLAAAAVKLRQFADELDGLDAAGWRLEQPIDDDYGFLVQPNDR